MAGLQCLRRLWLLVHEPQAYEEPPAGSPLAVGYEIGRHAHILFPGGVLVAEEPWQHAEAVARTFALMNDPAVPAIFEAAFTHDDTRIRIDVLERMANGWGLREVKSSTRGRAFRQYDAADPANRLVAGELEARWNQALACFSEIEAKVAAYNKTVPADVADPASLAMLASDLKAVWAAPSRDSNEGRWSESCDYPETQCRT